MRWKIADWLWLCVTIGAFLAVFQRPLRLMDLVYLPGGFASSFCWLSWLFYLEDIFPPPTPVNMGQLAFFVGFIIGMAVQAVVFIFLSTAIICHPLSEIRSMIEHGLRRLADAASRLIRGK